MEHSCNDPAGVTAPASMASHVGMCMHAHACVVGFGGLLGTTDGRKSHYGMNLAFLAASEGLNPDSLLEALYNRYTKSYH